MRLECLEERALLRNPAELDLTFSGDGKLTDTFGTEARSAMFQSAGKMVVAGQTTTGSGSGNAAFGLTRYNSDGKITTDFGAGADEARAVAIQTDGQIVVVGETVQGGQRDFAVARYCA